MTDEEFEALSQLYHAEAARRKATKKAHSPKAGLLALKDFDSLPNSANVRLAVVAALFGISTVTVWRWSAAGRLPSPVKMGGVTAWNVGELRSCRLRNAG